MASTNAVKITSGIEGTAGTAVPRTAVLPIADPGTLDRKVERLADPIIIGTNMLAGEYKAQGNVAGSIPLTPRASSGMGHILKSLYGTEEANPSQVIGCIRVKYTGSAASCKLTCDVSAKTIVAASGAKGAETADANFGTAGTLKLAEGTSDTVSEVVALIEGYTDFECDLVWGADTGTVASVRTDAAMQAKGKDALIFLTGTSGAYAHRFTPNLDSTTERPTLSIQMDGYGDNYLYDGVVVNELALSGALKDFIKGDATLMGFGETGSQSASAVVMETATPLRFADGLTVIDGTDYVYIRDFSLKFNSGHREDGYVQGDYDRAYHQKGIFGAEGEMTLRLDSSSQALRAKVDSGALGSLLLVFKGGAIGSAGAYETLIVELPYVTYSSAERSANSGIFDLKVNFKALSPSGTQYDEPVICWLVTDDSAVYAAS